MDKSILSVLDERFASFSKGQKRIARYILTDLHRAAFLSAGALGKETEVSESTVVRFAAELGYEGFPQMQKALQDALLRSFTSDNTQQDHMVQANQDFSGVLQAVYAARRIYLLGSGADKVLADYMGMHLEKKMADVHILTKDSSKLRHAGAGDVIVIFSFQPDSTVAEVAAQCADAGVKVIGITTSESEAIYPYCDYALFAKAEKSAFGYSLSAAMTLVDSLLQAVFSAEEVNAYEI